MTAATTDRGTTTSTARDWRQDAACRGADPEQFFPAATRGRLYDEQVAAAKAICAGCPVRPECLAHALVWLPDGIAAGLTPEERRALTPARRGRKPGTEQPCGSPGAAAAHRRAGEDPCGACRESERVRKALSRGARTSRCGSDAGYAAHRRRPERPCRACQDAHNTAERAQYARNRRAAS